MNGKTKITTGVIVAVVAGGSIAFVTSLVAGNKEIRESHTQHELSTDAHPVLNEKVDTITKNVDKITGNVEKIMLLQERQTALMENMAQDIGELKDN